VFFRIRRIALFVAAATFLFSNPVQAQKADGAPHGGLKKTVSVAAFEAPELAQGGATADELNALLVGALLADGRFVVLERASLADMTNEQTLAQGGAVAAGGAAQPARFLTGSAIVRGTVTKFDPGTHGGSLSVGGLPFLGGGGLGVSSQTAEVTINLRVIDSTTGQILRVATAKGHATTKSLQVQARSGGYDWNGGSFLKTPLGEALQDAIRKSVDEIGTAMAKMPWSALVIDCDGSNVYLTAGENQGVAEGQVFKVYRKGKVLTDPASGVVLDVLMEPVGTVQVKTVRDKISIATTESGGVPARGDVVKAE
jgi:curli biogenesis system outer membrane secretion channel CsgG